MVIPTTSSVQEHVSEGWCRYEDRWEELLHLQIGNYHYLASVKTSHLAWLLRLAG